jgi:ribosomal protein L7/L12
MGITATTSYVYTSPKRCGTVTLDEGAHRQLVDLASTYAGHVPTGKIALIKTVRRLTGLGLQESCIIAEAMIEEAQVCRSALPMEPGDCCDD